MFNIPETTVFLLPTKILADTTHRVSARFGSEVYDTIYAIIHLIHPWPKNGLKLKDTTVIPMVQLLYNCIRYTVYQVFSACIHFPVCSREYQSREKCIRVNLTQSIANQVDCQRLLLGFCAILIRVDLINSFRMEFTEKTWCVNNPIYGN